MVCAEPGGATIALLFGRRTSATRRLPWLAVALLAVCGQLHAQEAAPVPMITALADRPSALYAIGEKVVFTVSLDAAVESEIKFHYSLLENGLTTLVSGDETLVPGKSRFTLAHEWRKPSFVLLKIEPQLPGAKMIRGGAACEPEKLEPALPKPDDFDAYWDGKKALLDAMPFNASLVAVPELTDDTIETFAFTLDNINGSKVRGYFAKPKGEGPFPALVHLDGAGVFSAKDTVVADHARRGVMAIIWNEHDIENGQPAEYYKELEQNALKAWSHRGSDDRDSSYFLRMCCACYRAAQFITARPEWDRKHFIATGSSLGGAMSIVTAYLCPKVTAVAANVPALCDHAGPLSGRAAGWPKWVAYTKGQPDEKQHAASRYYDTVNFAGTVRARALVSAGFIDTTCAPSSVYTAYNVLPGEKRFLNMPTTGHSVVAVWEAEQDAFLAVELGLKP